MSLQFKTRPQSNPQSSRPPYRKFIALVLSLSIAISGLSAAPARADEDVAKFIAGMALLGLVGVAINKAGDKPSHSGHYQSHPHRPHSYPHRPGPKPMPPAVARYDLPKHCVRILPKYSSARSVMPRNCLQQNYRFAHKLPRACQVTFWNGRKNRTVYRTGCLQQKGYRLVNR